MGSLFLAKLRDPCGKPWMGHIVQRANPLRCKAPYQFMLALGARVK